VGAIAREEVLFDNPKHKREEQEIQTPRHELDERLFESAPLEPLLMSQQEKQEAEIKDQKRVEIKTKEKQDD